MLARVGRNGLFEVLTAAAWARALGYRSDELSGKSFSKLLQLGSLAAGAVVAALLDQEDGEPLEVTLRCKDARPKTFRLYRRYDPNEEAMFLFADELVEQRREPAPPSGCRAAFGAEQTGVRAAF
jgi:hypothetical protein